MITTYGKPFPPTNLEVVEGDGEISLTWSPTTDDGGRPVLEYLIRMGTSEVSMTDLERVDVSVMSYTATGLENGMTYFFTVAAISDVGEGDATQVLSGSPLGAPGSPTGLRAEEGEMVVTLSWIPPTEDGGRPITTYMVMRGDSGSSMEKVGQTTSLGFEDTDVDALVTYTYTIVAVNEAGEGQPSAEASATPRAVPAPPSSPREVTVVQVKDTIMVTWMVPSDEGSEAITGYIVYRGQGTDELTVVGTVDANTFVYIDKEGLKDGKTYTYSVKAKNSVGPGPMALTEDQKFKKEDESPGFGAVVVAMALLGAILMMAVRRR
jgi:hypothetical protein